MKSCYITASHPATERLGQLRRLLGQRGIQVIVPTDFAAALDTADLIRATISKAEWVLGVITSEVGHENVYFELGVAVGLGKRHLLLVEPGVETPTSLQNTLQLRTRLENEEALLFAIEQMLAAPKPKKARKRHDQSYRPLGADADRLLAHLSHISSVRPPLGLESFVESLLKQGGVTTMATSLTTPGRWHYDIAVWIDELQPYVGNPLPIEVRYEIPEPAELQRLNRKVTGGGSPWVLVLHVQDSIDPSDAWSRLPSTILHIRIADLVEKMRTSTFPDVVRDLRNRAIHGVSA